MAIRALGKALMKAGIMPSNQFLAHEAKMKQEREARIEARKQEKAKATANLTMKGIIDGCDS